MRGFKILEELPRWLDLHLFCVLQTLTDTFLPLSILHDSCCFSLHCQHHGAFGFPELLHLDVVSNVKHRIAPAKAPF